MTREERKDAIDIIQSILNKYEEDECLVTEITIGDEDIKAFRMAIKALEQEPILDKIRAEINKNIEQEDFARSVFINKEKDYRKANQCTGNLQAYEIVLDMIDNLLKENEDV